jgi:WD40 repeat protein
MPLASGTELGPYKILGPLGAGGMGEVYRARDTRLRREVAIKVVPSSHSSDQDLLRRFEQEARAASALNHPNIISIYDFGSMEYGSYIVMEYVEGKTLKELLASGLLPNKKMLDIAAQVSEGLAKAHSAGIVHRDLKPANIMVSKDGFVKILDFGLAKLMFPVSEELSDMSTLGEHRTQNGQIVGTVAYMSPEQASGKAVDYRSDQFSLGTVLYEMATGKIVFHRAFVADTLSAIIHQDPEPIESLNHSIPAPYRWIVERCLAKDPEDRYASTRDLAHDLASVRNHLSDITPVDKASQEPLARLRRMLRWALLSLALLSITVLAYFVGRRGALVGEATIGKNSASVPLFHRLTFRRGTIWSARFAPDGQTIVYGAAWEGNPFEIFSTRVGSPESRSFGLASADVLSVSVNGEMAISLGRRLLLGGNETVGTLARVPFSGGAPREILEDVAQADWDSSGNQLAVARIVKGRYRLEFPIGQVLYETNGWISHLRLSPKSDKVGFIDHPIRADDRGLIAVIDSGKEKRILTGEWFSVQGLAWSTSGEEIWFTASKEASGSALYSVNLSRTQRLVTRIPGRLNLQDIFRDGRVLFTREDLRDGIFAFGPGDSRERDLSWFDGSLVTGISPDGRKILFFEGWEGGGKNMGVYIRGTDGSPAVRLGDGRTPALSPDGKWILSVSGTQPQQLILMPIGAGSSRALPRGSIASFMAPTWFSDGNRILFAGREPGRGMRLYVQDLATGKQTSITPEGVIILLGQPISPDGKLVAAIGPDRKVCLYPVNGGPSLSLPEFEPGDFPVRWSPDSRLLYVGSARELVLKLYRWDLSTHSKELWKVITPSDKVGLVGVGPVQITPDGRSYAYHYVRQLSDLYLVEGLK